jgi:hypothetical protein
MIKRERKIKQVRHTAASKKRLLTKIYIFRFRQKIALTQWVESLQNENKGKAFKVECCVDFGF